MPAVVSGSVSAFADADASPNGCEPADVTVAPSACAKPLALTICSTSCAEEARAALSVATSLVGLFVMTIPGASSIALVVKDGWHGPGSGCTVGERQLPDVPVPPVGKAAKTMVCTWTVFAELPLSGLFQLTLTVTRRATGSKAGWPAAATGSVTYVETVKAVDRPTLSWTVLWCGTSGDLS